MEGQGVTGDSRDPASWERPRIACRAGQRLDNIRNRLKLVRWTMKTKRTRKPRRLSLVRFAFENLPRRWHRDYPFKPRRAYLFLGEIANMGGHCVVIDPQTNRIYSGYHTGIFVELTADEI